MDEKTASLRAFGGLRGIVLMAAAFVAVIGYQTWERGGNRSTFRELGKELGLRFEQSGTRPQLRGRIEDTGVAIEVTTDGVSNQSSTRYVTRFRLSPESGPYGRVVGASFRQRLLEELSDDDPVATGDAAFDEEVFLYGQPEQLLGHFGPEARSVVRTATEAGWALDGYTWEVRVPGRMTDATEVRNLLHLGLAAVQATRRPEEAPLAEPPADATPTSVDKSPED